MSAPQVSGHRVSGDRVSGDLVSGDRVSGDLVSGDRVSGDRMSGDRMSGDRMFDDTMFDHQASDDPVSGDHAAIFRSGNACLARGDAAAAVAAFAACLRLRPEHPPALFNLANAQFQAGAVVDSAETLLRCLRGAPAFGPAYVNLAQVLLRLGLVEQACGVAADGTRLLSGSVEAWLALGVALHHGGDHAGAVAAYQAALRLAPRHAGALSSLGNTLRAMGRLEQALAIHDRAVAAASPGAGPEHAAARFHRATTLLAAGDYAAGWAEYEWRWACAGRAPRFPAPPWRGEPLGGLTILLHAEQGLGDTLQFVRYAPLVAARGGRVVLEVAPTLVRLLRGLPGVSAVVARGDRLPAFDVHCPLLSLPLAFATTLDSIPVATAYLRADAEQVAAWRRRLPRRDRPMVGLVWAGLPNLDHWEARLIDRRRSLDPTDLAALAGLDGPCFVSVQKDRPPPSHGLPMIDVMAEMRDFADTAALVCALDLVIAVDTAVAHLAAALGRPVWLLSRYDGCWRWLQGRADSPWYPTLRIYRQAQPFAWPAVIAQVRRDLDQLVRHWQRAVA